MRIDVSSVRCEANGVCAGTAPEYFRLREDDTLEVLRQEVDEDDKGLLDEAVAGCPRAAITLESP